jgi:hypothetical protein
VLASADDVALELGLESADDLSAAQALRVPSLLARASYLFQQAADRLFIPDTYTVRLRVQGGQVRLPESPVTDVDSVVDDAGNDVTYTRYGQWLRIESRFDSNVSFAALPAEGCVAFVTVTYDGGAIPDVVKGAVAAMAARYVSIDPATQVAGATTVNLVTGPFQSNITYADWATEAMCLSEDDKALAESFRYKGTQVVVQRP